MSSYNNNAFRYSSRKVNRYNKENDLAIEHVNFWRDVWNSFGFGRGNRDQKISQQQGALFKIGSLNLSIYHDLGNWELTASYSIRPESMWLARVWQGFT